MKIQLRKNVLRSLLVKEFSQILRDKRMTAMLFIQPLIMLFLLGYAVNTDVKDIKIAVWDEDRTFESRSFIQKFTASEYFIFYDYLNSEKEINMLLDKGEADVFFHIARGFSKDVKSGKHTDVQLILDGTDSNRAAVILSYVNQITNDFSLDYFKDRIRLLMLNRDTGGVRMKETIGIQERALFNPVLASRNFFLPGVIGFLITLVTIMLTSMAVVKEKEAGTIEQIIVSPLRPAEYILGKTLPFVIISFIDICIVTFMAIVWFNVPFAGSFLFLLLSGLVYTLSSLPIGLYISTISRTQQQAILSTFLYFMPAMMFSGFVFPIYAMPVSIQAITYLNPLRYYITILRGIFLKGVGIAVLWPEMLALLLFSILLLTLSIRRFARRME